MNLVASEHLESAKDHPLVLTLADPLDIRESAQGRLLPSLTELRTRFLDSCVSRVLLVPEATSVLSAAVLRIAGLP